MNLFHHKAQPKPVPAELLHLQFALDQYISAQSYFNQACGNEQVEHAVFQLEAARRGYCLALNACRNTELSRQSS